MLMNSRESCEMYPDVQRLQKLLPRCTARAVAFRFSEFAVCAIECNELLELANEVESGAEFGVRNA